MSSDTRETLSDLLNPIEYLRDILVGVRASVEGIIFTTAPSTPESVTQLLSAVPLAVCEKLSCGWAGVREHVPANEIEQWFTSEDRLLLDMVLAMYDDRRSFLTQQQAAGELAETPRG